MALPKLEKQNLGAAVFEVLRNAIINVEFQPGQRLIVDDLARGVGISRTPIRDALRLLLGIGLVEGGDGTPFRVVSLSPEDIEDIFQVRLALERLAARTASQRMPDDEIASLTDLVDTAARGALQADAPPRWMIEHDPLFHGAIVRGSRNRRLDQMMAGIYDLVSWIRHLTPQDAVRAIHVLAEHRAIVDAISRRDAEAAERAMVVHLTRVKERTFEQMSSRFATDPRAEDADSQADDEATADDATPPDGEEPAELIGTHRNS